MLDLVDSKLKAPCRRNTEHERSGGHTQTVLATLRTRQATFRESIFPVSKDGS